MSTLSDHKTEQSEVNDARSKMRALVAELKRHSNAETEVENLARHLEEAREHAHDMLQMLGGRIEYLTKMFVEFNRNRKDFTSDIESTAKSLPSKPGKPSEIEAAHARMRAVKDRVTNFATMSDNTAAARRQVHDDGEKLKRVANKLNEVERRQKMVEAKMTGGPTDNNEPTSELLAAADALDRMQASAKGDRAVKMKTLAESLRMFVKNYPGHGATSSASSMSNSSYSSATSTAPESTAAPPSTIATAIPGATPVSCGILPQSTPVTAMCNGEIQNLPGSEMLLPNASDSIAEVRARVNMGTPKPFEINASPNPSGASDMSSKSTKTARLIEEQQNQ